MEQHAVFNAVNCKVLIDNIVESDLCGYVEVALQEYIGKRQV